MSWNFVGPLRPGDTRAPAPSTPTQPSVPHNFVGPLAPGETRAPAPSTPTQPSTFSPMPPEPGSKEYIVRQQGNQIWAIKGSTVKPIFTHDPSTPLKKSITGYEITPPSQAIQPPTITPNFSNLNPTKILSDPVSFAKEVITTLGWGSNLATEKGAGSNPVIRVGNTLYGMEAWGGNTLSTIKDTAVSLVGIAPTPTPFPIVNQQQAIGQNTGQVLASVALVPVTGGTSLLWGLVNVGASQILNKYGPAIPIINPNPTGKWDTNPTNILNTFLTGQVTAGVARGFSPLIGKGIGYVASRDIPILSRGAQITARIGQYIDAPINKLRASLPERLGGVSMFREGEAVLGKAGTPVKTFVSEPLESLGGKSLRVINDVTINPAEVKTLAQEYVGQNVPTGHATLTPENFSLRKGDVTLLKGFPGEGAGFRAENQLSHFYSAPGSEEYVNVYGGYIGVGTEYAEGPIKTVFGGKPTALVTTNTEISNFAPLRGESMNDYLARTSALSGKTGIAQENYLGHSTERQFITPASYERLGAKLPGSVFISEGKIGKFGIEEYQGVFKNVPALRDLTARYTFMDVYKGSYAPVEGFEEPNAILNVAKYNEAYVPTRNISPSSVNVGLGVGSVFSLSSIRSRASLSSSVISRATSIGSQRSLSIGNSGGSLDSMLSSPSSIGSVFSRGKPSVRSQISVPSLESQMSIPSMKSQLSIPSMGKSQGSLSRYSASISSLTSMSTINSVFSIPSRGSGPISISDIPSYPSHPSKPSMPSYPSNPSPPSVPSYPSYPPVNSDIIIPKSNNSAFYLPSDLFGPDEKKTKRRGKPLFEGLISKQKLYPILTAHEFIGIKEKRSTREGFIGIKVKHASNYLKPSQREQLSARSILGIKTTHRRRKK
jgi:hypothetical protein